MDVVKARLDHAEEEHIFLVMAGVGYDATIMANTNEDLKDKVGWLAYVEAGIRNLPGKPLKATISIDGQYPVRRRLRSVMVGNCGKVKGGLEIFPDAKVDDGLLDVVILAPVDGSAGSPCSPAFSARATAKNVGGILRRANQRRSPSNTTMITSSTATPRARANTS